MDQFETPINKKRELAAAIVVLIVIVGVVGIVAMTNKKKSADAVVLPPTVSQSSGSNPTSTPQTYKDGNYSATGSYNSPGGEESITVSVALKNGTVTSTSAQNGANDPEAEEYQDEFIAGYKQQVVGKNIASLNLSRVSGSSLTSQGFNSAIAKIKAAAQA